MSWVKTVSVGLFYLAIIVMLVPVLALFRVDMRMDYVDDLA